MAFIPTPFLRPPFQHQPLFISRQPVAPRRRPSASLSQTGVTCVAAAILLAGAPDICAPTPPVALATTFNSPPQRYSHDEEDPKERCRLSAHWDVRSSESLTETLMVFSNDSNAVIDLWWVDYCGAEVYYATINPNMTHLQPSFVSHPWVVRDHISHNSLLVTVAEENSETRHISAKHTF